MDTDIFRSWLQQERRRLVRSVKDNRSSLTLDSDSSAREIEEQAQIDRDISKIDSLDAMERSRIALIDGALERIETAQFGNCISCGRTIAQSRLEADPAISLCADCEARAPGDTANADEDNIPAAGALPPDLEGLDDEELKDYLTDLVFQDGRIETQELDLCVRKGVIYLEGALPSGSERQILVNLLTDVAGVRDLVDNLEIQRLAWERPDRTPARNSNAAVPDAGREPANGTADINRSEEEGINYNPPDNPPAPSKD